MLLVLLACIGPLSSRLPPDDVDDTDEPDTGSRIRTVQHCGVIEADEVWAADVHHRVTCNVVVDGGTLTVEGGASVAFNAGTSLSVGIGDHAASLVVDGAAAGVVFGPTQTAEWAGVTLGPSAAPVAIAGLSVRGTTDGVRVQGAEVQIGSLAVDGASAGCGLTLTGGARLAAGSEGVTVSGAGGWSVCAETATADSLPVAASSYVGNGEDGVYVSGGSLTTAVTWEALGVPYVLSETVDVGGTAAEPGVLTITEGVSVEFERDVALRFSRTEAASALHVLGTEGAPVSFAAHDADTAGFWRGIEVSRGAELVELSYLTLTGAGAKEAALLVADAPVAVQGVVVERSATTGVQLEGGAAFVAGGSGLAITDCDVPLLLPAAAVGSLPTSGLSLVDNGTAAVKVAGGGTVSGSGTWPDPGLPYWVDDDIRIDGTAASPAVVTLAPGVSLLFGNDTGLYVGKSGAAGLRVAGTAALPVTMGPWSANEPGAWAGVGIYDSAVDAEVVIAHADIGYAGGTALKGNLHVADASPTVTDVTLHDGLEWGLYLTGTSAPALADISYRDNGSGDCFGCP